MFCFPNRVSKHFYDLYWENKSNKLREVYCINRGTQREYRSKPLKHTIVERILVFLNTKIRRLKTVDIGIFYPLKIFHLF